MADTKGVPFPNDYYEMGNEAVGDLNNFDAIVQQAFEEATSTGASTDGEINDAVKRTLVSYYQNGKFGDLDPEEFLRRANQIEMGYAGPLELMPEDLNMDTSRGLIDYDRSRDGTNKAWQGALKDEQASTEAPQSTVVSGSEFETPNGYDAYNEKPLTRGMKSNLHRMMRGVPPNDEDTLIEQLLLNKMKNKR